MLPLYAGVVNLVLLASFAPVVFGSYVNVTIDDTSGDAETGVLPTYFGTSNGSTWLTNVDCEQSGLCPDELIHMSSVFNKTWHATWGPAELAINFNGFAVYAYFVVPGYANESVVPLGSNITFSIDGALTHTYVNIPRVGDLPREELVFSIFNLTDGVHQLSIYCSPYVSRNDANISAMAIFDRAVYTFENSEMPAMSVKTGVPFGTHSRLIIIGASSGVAALFVILLICFFCAYRRRRAAIKKNMTRVDSFHVPRPPSPNRQQSLRSLFSLRVHVRRSEILGAYKQLEDLEAPAMAVESKRARAHERQQHSRSRSEALPLVAEENSPVAEENSSVSVRLHALSDVHAEAGSVDIGRSADARWASEADAVPPRYEDIIFALPAGLRGSRTSTERGVRLSRWMRHFSRGCLSPDADEGTGAG